MFSTKETNNLNNLRVSYFLFCFVYFNHKQCCTILKGKSCHHLFTMLSFEIFCVFHGTQKGVNGVHSCQVRYFISNRRVHIFSLFNAILSYNIMLQGFLLLHCPLWSPHSLSLYGKEITLKCRFGS